MLTDKMRRTDVSIFFFYLVGSRDLFQSRLGGGTPLTYLPSLSPNEIVKPGPLKLTSSSQWVKMFKAFLKLHLGLFLPYYFFLKRYTYQPTSGSLQHTANIYSQMDTGTPLKGVHFTSICHTHYNLEV